MTKRNKAYKFQWKAVLLHSFKTPRKYRILVYNIGVTILVNVVKQGQADKAINIQNVHALTVTRIVKGKTKEGDTN